MHEHALKRYGYSWLQNSARNSLPKSLTHPDKSAQHHLPHMGKGGDKHRSYRRPQSRAKIASAFTLSPVLTEVTLSYQTRASVQRSPYAGAEKDHCKARTCPAMGGPLVLPFLINAGKRCQFVPQKHKASAHLSNSTAQVTQDLCCPSNEPLSSSRTGQPLRAPFAFPVSPFC